MNPMPSAAAFASIVAMPRLDELRHAQTALSRLRVAEARAKWRAPPGMSGFERIPIFPLLPPLSAVQVKLSDVGGRSLRLAVVQRGVSRHLPLLAWRSGPSACSWRTRERARLVVLTHDPG